MADYIHKTKCRVCSSSRLVKILDLGKTPLANSFLKKKDLLKPYSKFPLRVYFCRKCFLVQLCDVVNPVLMFGNYHYATSASKPLVKHFRRFGAEVVKRFIKNRDDLVVEIGSNDGVLLDAIKGKCTAIGVDPAKNITKSIKGKGVKTICKFFSNKVSKEIVKHNGHAKVVIANNVVAHINDLGDLFGGVKNLMTEDGVFMLEVHWVGNLVGGGGFDQIYHEHLSYFSLHSLSHIVESVGLKILDVKLIPIHGQSIRVYVGKTGLRAKSVTKFLTMEKKLGLNKAETYKVFSRKIEDNKRNLIDLLINLKKQNKKIIGYGAPAKGNTLLNYFKINNKIVDFITDTTPLKQGLYTPGTHIPISAPEKIKKDRPDYILLLSWNYADAILKKEIDLRKDGIKFIIPVPEVRIV